MAATGSFWCHEQWNLSSPPDFVTFAKKMLSCGFYHTEETKMETPNRHFNTYFGDPLRAWLTVAQNGVIKEDNLIDGVQKSGTYLKNELAHLADKHPKFIKNPRGLGTFQAFDCVDAPVRDSLIKQLKTHGVQCGGVGD